MHKKNYERKNAILFLLIIIGFLISFSFFLKVSLTSQNPMFISIGGNIIDPGTGNGVNDLKLEVYNLTLEEKMYLSTDGRGVWSNNSFIRKNDIYSIRPMVYYDLSYCPKGFWCNRELFSPNPWSYEYQHAGNNDCGTSCNFIFAPLTPTPLPH